MGYFEVYLHFMFYAFILLWITSLVTSEKIRHCLVTKSLLNIIRWKGTEAFFVCLLVLPVIKFTEKATHNSLCSSLWSMFVNINALIIGCNNTLLAKSWASTYASFFLHKITSLPILSPVLKTGKIIQDGAENRFLWLHCEGCFKFQDRSWFFNISPFLKRNVFQRMGDTCG